MKLGSLFSGIGGGELGLEWAGLGETVWQVELDEWCRSILARHWPGAKRYADVREVGAHNLEPVDLIVGGYPCQDVSSAGKGEGLAGTRSGLWYQFARILGEMRPRWAVVENVASGAGRWVDPVVSGLEELGYEAIPLQVRAVDVGAPHLRARVFVVARRVSYTDGEPKREQQQRLPGRRAPSLRDEGSTESGDLGTEMANGNGNGSQALGRSGLFYEERPAFGHDAHGRGGAWTWPPGPSSPAWSAYIAAGGPEPGIRRAAHGLPCGLARDEWKRRLMALGNAIVPAQMQVVGEFIKLIEEEDAQSASSAV